MEVDLPRPRTRKALLEHPDYYRYRGEVLAFLEEYEGGATPRATAEARSRLRPARRPEEVGDDAAETRRHRQRHGAGPRRSTTCSRRRPTPSTVTIFNAETARQLQPHHAVAGAVGREDLRGHRHPRRRLVRREWRDAAQGEAVVRIDREAKAVHRRGRHGGRLRQAGHRHRLGAVRHRRCRATTCPASSPTATSTTSTRCSSAARPGARAVVIGGGLLGPRSGGGPAGARHGGDRPPPDADLMERQLDAAAGYLLQQATRSARGIDVIHRAANTEAILGERPGRGRAARGRARATRPTSS